MGRRAHPIEPRPKNNGEQLYVFVIISHADSILVAADTMTKKEVKLEMDGCVRLGGVWWGVGVCGGWQGRGGVVGSVVSFFVLETSFCHQR